MLYGTLRMLITVCKRKQQLYEAEISLDTFMELASFSKLPNESFRQFFERLVDHVQKY